MSACIRQRLASCRATVCSAAGQGANKPSLSFVGFHLVHSSSLPSLVSFLAHLSLLSTSHVPNTHIPHCLHHPLNSAPSGFPATHTSHSLPFIRHPAWSFSFLTRTVSPTQLAIRSPIIRIRPSTSHSTANSPVFLLPRIVLGGPRGYPQSITQHGMIPLEASHRTSLP